MALWYYASAVDSEYWRGGYHTREQAIGNGRVWAKGEPFWIGLGAPPQHKLDIFDATLTPVTLAFDEANEENYGDDGEGGPDGWGETACADLARRLNDVFSTWAQEHGYQRGWIIDVIDQEEIRSILTLAHAGER